MVIEGHGVAIGFGVEREENLPAGGEEVETDGCGLRACPRRRAANRDRRGDKRTLAAAIGADGIEFAIAEERHHLAVVTDAGQFIQAGGGQHARGGALAPEQEIAPLGIHHRQHASGGGSGRRRGGGGLGRQGRLPPPSAWQRPSWRPYPALGRRRAGVPGRATRRPGQKSAKRAGQAKAVCAAYVSLLVNVWHSVARVQGNLLSPVWTKGAGRAFPV